MLRLLHAIGSNLRSGAWVSPARIRVYGLLCLAGFALFIALLAMRLDGLSEPDGQPIGTDFSNVYAAGRLVNEGRAPQAYDWALEHSMEKSIFGEHTPFYGWHYPPMFLGLAAALALLPYMAALFTWQASTLAFYLASILRIAGRPGWFIPALAYPAVIVNIGHGHNGFLTAALFGLGLALLERRPIVAGLLLGALCYKPQFVLLLPLALAAGGYWRAVLAAGACALALALLSVGLFGLSTWRAFFDSLELTRTIVLEQGSTGWQKIQSVFSAARNWGLGVPAAYALQGMVDAIVAVAVVALWRSRADFTYKAAALLAGALLATPYVLDYDMMTLAPALAFLAVHGLRDGFAPYERSILALVWAAPFGARLVMGATTIPLGAIAIGALFATAIWRGFDRPDRPLRRSLAGAAIDDAYDGSRSKATLFGNSPLSN
jgi:alpha-1,2-mannosyltransferase